MRVCEVADVRACARARVVVRPRLRKCASISCPVRARAMISSCAVCAPSWAIACEHRKMLCDDLIVPRALEQSRLVVRKRERPRLL
eukprot:6212140-Pleurochrysis_carterae.AAC.1